MRPKGTGSTSQASCKTATAGSRAQTKNELQCLPPLQVAFAVAVRLLQHARVEKHKLPCYFSALYRVDAKSQSTDAVETVAHTVRCVTSLFLVQGVFSVHFSGDILS